MGLSQELISQFVKITNDSRAAKKDTVLYGTIKEFNGTTFVKLDGSDMLTPYESITEVKDGERVAVTIKNHTLTATGNMSSPSARGETVSDLSSTVKKIQADSVTTENLAAVNAKIENLETVKLVAIDAKIENLEADMITTEELDAKYANIKDLNAANASIQKLSTEKANIKDLSAQYASIDFANIDFANIDKAVFKEFYANSGIIKDVVVDDQQITGTLVGVTIKGDLIEGNTIVADKLVIKGTDGLYYKLNTDGVKTEAEQTDYNSLNGSIITAKSITATKIAVEDLVAFGATIGGFKITDDAIYSGVKESATNDTRGVFMNSDGEFACGDANNHLKYYKDKNGNYKFEIACSNVASKDDISDMATKGDIADMATKGDIANMATTDDISDMATKNDIAGMLTQSDISDMATKNDIAGMLTQSDIADMATKGDIADMATKGDIADMATKDDISDMATTDDLDEMSNDFNVILVNQNTSISSDYSSLIQRALVDYVATGDFEAYKGTVETMIEQRATGITMSLTNTIEKLEREKNELANTVASYEKHFTFTANGIGIKDACGNNTAELRLDTGIVSFRKNDKQYGWWDGVDFHTGNIVVDMNERAQLGNFAFIPRTDGSLSFLKVKDEFVADLCKYFYKPIDRTQQGIHYTSNGDGVYRAVGTATAYTICNLVSSSGAIPDWLQIGEKYIVKFTTTSPNFGFRVMSYVGTTPSTILATTTDSEFVLPADCTGVILRLYVTNGAVLDDECTLKIYHDTRNVS